MSKERATGASSVNAGYGAEDGTRISFSGFED